MHKDIKIEIIPKKGDFSEYINYVLKNRHDLIPESKYVQKHLLKGDSWGEILVAKNQDQIVASFGPNRIEKDKNGKIRARPGYLTVLPKFRGRKIGSALWQAGLVRMKKMGADYVSVSVEKDNLPALKIYQKSGLKIQPNITEKYVLREIAGKTFLVPLVSNPDRFIFLNKTAYFVWKQLASGIPVVNCVRGLSLKYKIPKETIKTDIKRFLKKIELGKMEAVGVKRLNKNLKTGRTPIQGSFELTGRCNLNCFHCYAKGERDKEELQFQEIKKLLDQLVKNGCLFLQLTGGECLSRKDFSQIYLYLRQAGIVPTISTNATLFDDNLISVMGKYPPYCIIISLYASKALIHDQITQIKGSFKKTLANVKKLKKAGLAVRFSAVIFRENLAEVKKMKKLADRLKVPVIFYPYLTPALNKDATPLAHCVGNEECIRVLALNKKRGKFSRENNAIYPCNAGRQSFHIDCQGNLYLCKIERGVGYTLLKNSFQEIWKKLDVVRLKKLRLPKTCLNCSQKAVCRTCPSMRRLYKDSGLDKNFCKNLTYNIS